jgi:hypothetical protein
MDAGGTARTAAAGEIGQRRERRACAAVVVDQRAEGARADIVAANEAKPIEALLLAQPHAATVFAHGMIRCGRKKSPRRTLSPRHRQHGRLRN